MAANCEVNLEVEFSPSMWSKRFSHRDEVIQNHVKHADRVSAEVLSLLNYKLDIPYGDSENQKLDILGTDLPADSPILVFIHGGFWQELSRPQSRYPAGPLYSGGIKTIVVGYDLCPQVTLFDIVKQIEKAVKFVFEYAEKENSRGVYFAGHSAGAHLIASILSDAQFLNSISNISILQGAILVSGVYDLTTITDTSVNKNLQLTQQDAKLLSPHFRSYFHLKDYKFRLYILAGEDDSFTFQRQSRDFYDMLQECGNVDNINFQIKESMDHFEIMESITEEENYFKAILLEDIFKYLSR